MQGKETIVFWGTPNFAVPSLEALIRAKLSIAAVVTKPDEPAGRGQELTPPPVKVCAETHGIPVFQPSVLTLAQLPPEVSDANLFIVAAYGKILPQVIVDLPPFGTLNIHPSLLPRWRGPSPIQTTVLAGDKETGVTIIKLDELMDHGPIVAQRKCEIGDKKVTYQKLHDELAALSAELIVDTVPGWLAGSITPLAQDDARATFSKLFKKDDGRVKWEKSAEDIERMVRALNPWPGTWSLCPGDVIYRIRIEEAVAVEDEASVGSPGFLWQNDSYPLLVAAGRGSLAVRRLTMGGKKTLSADAFVRGYGEFLGHTLI